MEYAGHVAAVEREIAAITEGLAAGPLDVRVPTCPDWTLGDLAAHVGQFSGFWAHVLCEGTGTAKPPFSDPPSGADLVPWFEEVSPHLVTMLRATPPETEVWTWKGDDQSARFVGRRCANELAVHRFDVQTARGNPAPIDPELAADGIEEIFMMIGVRGEPSGRASGQTLHLHSTDSGDEWLIRLLPGGIDVARDHAKADLALRGAVSDLELVLYQRPPVSGVERLGDEGVLDAWYREFKFG
jgi:uncharacterized protein (TIGR03083 family)